MPSDSDSDSGLSTALNTNALEQAGMVPDGFDNTPTSLPTQRLYFKGVEYIKVEHTANKRANSPQSMI
jgi:hypothetical protein